MADFARRYAWILPVAYAALLAAIGFVVPRASLKAGIASELETTRNTTASALQIWAEENMAVAKVPDARRSGRRTARGAI